MPRLLISIFLFFNIFLFVQADSSNQVQYPQDYRQWQHIKSMLILPGHALENPFAGIHHIYANEKAVQGLNTGHYEDGAEFVFDLLHALDGDHAFIEGERKLIGVMSKNRKQFSTTGGWGFEGFAENSRTDRLVKDGGQSCYGCHTQRTEHDFVFTTLRN